MILRIHMGKSIPALLFPKNNNSTKNWPQPFFKSCPNHVICQRLFAFIAVIMSESFRPFVNAPQLSHFHHIASSLHFKIPIGSCFVWRNATLCRFQTLRVLIVRPTWPIYHYLGVVVLGGDWLTLWRWLTLNNCKASRHKGVKFKSNFN